MMLLSLLVQNLRYRWAEWRTHRRAEMMPADYQVKE